MALNIGRRNDADAKVKARRTRIKKRLAAPALFPSPPKPKPKQTAVALRPGDAERYHELKRRKFNGKELPIDDWVWMMDVGQHFGDPSPENFGIRIK